VRRGSKEHVHQNVVKRFSLYPSSGRFGRVDGFRYTTLTAEDALNRVGNDAFLMKVMVWLRAAQRSRDSESCFAMHEI